MTPILEHISKQQVRWIRSLQQKKVRDEEGVFVAEGEKCIGELLGKFELVVLVDSSNATEEEVAQMSSLKTPQGSIAVFRKKDPTPLPPYSSTPTLCLALDNIQDPGNLGTIIRTADWFGISDIYCSKDTADCYNPKVVQATMGALARVNIHYVDLVTLLQGNPTPLLPYSPTPIYGTLLDGRNIYEAGAIPEPARGVIVMGNEGNGISEAVKKCITHPLYIPSYTPDTHIESLNVAVATAITLAEFRRLSQQK